MRVNANADPDDQRQDREQERDEHPARLLVLLDGGAHGAQSRRPRAAGGVLPFRRLAAAQQRKKEPAGSLIALDRG
ncbi:MAG: hypothetical protein ACRD0G_20190 [Acidimicrobiales bacterium]